MLKKRNSYSEEIAQVPPLKLNGPSPMRMEAHVVCMECRLYQKYFVPYVNLYIKYIKHFALWIKLLNFSIKVIVHN